MRRINVLQSLRAVFIVLICIEHMAFTNKLEWLGSGGEGVAFFIALSGFVTGYNYQKKEINSSFDSSIKFVLRKLKKFYGLHIVAIILSAILLLYSSIKNNGLNAKLQGLILLKGALNALFLQIYIPVKGWYMNDVHGVGWFLSTLVFCYLFSLTGLKIIKKAKDNNKTTLLFIFSLIIHASFILLFKDNELNSYFLYVGPVFRYLEYFMAMILGFNHVFEYKIMDKNFMYTIAEIAVVILWIMNHSLIKSKTLQENGNYHYSTMFVTAMLIIYVFSKEKGIFSKALDNKILIEIGNASFYIYILHQVIIKYVMSVFGWGNLGALISAIVIAIYTYLISRYYSVVCTKLAQILKNVKGNKP